MHFGSLYSLHISTHALTEGDGAMLEFEDMDLAISTHALTEGDKVMICFVMVTRDFNSRPHGGRRAMLEFEDMDLAISTHALTEGDGGAAMWDSDENGFQLTPSRRATDC